LLIPAGKDFRLSALDEVETIVKPSFMSSTTNGQHETDVVRRSSLYREFQAERDEILRHKWIESEKAGHDIGFERALTDWIIKHRSKWRKSRTASG
jgi:hypothetical protein